MCFTSYFVPTIISFYSPKKDERFEFLIERVNSLIDIEEAEKEKEKLEHEFYLMGESPALVARLRLRVKQFKHDARKLELVGKKSVLQRELRKLKRGARTSAPLATSKFFEAGERFVGDWTLYPRLSGRLPKVRVPGGYEVVVIPDAEAPMDVFNQWEGQTGVIYVSERLARAVEQDQANGPVALEALLREEASELRAKQQNPGDYSLVKDGQLNKARVDLEIRSAVVAFQGMSRGNLQKALTFWKNWQAPSDRRAKEALEYWVEMHQKVLDFMDGERVPSDLEVPPFEAVSAKTFRPGKLAEYIAHSKYLAYSV